MTPTLPEKVAHIESKLDSLNSGLMEIKTLQANQSATLHALAIGMATLTQTVNNIVAERSTWKNPLVYISFLSVAVAIITLVIRK